MASEQPENGIIIEYMDETTNSRHVEKHTMARTVAEFRTMERIPESATITVGEVLAAGDGSTPLTNGCEVVVVNGNKTGGVITSRKKVYDATHLHNTTNQFSTDDAVVTEVKFDYRGTTRRIVLVDGLTMPAAGSARQSKYPFAKLNTGQCFIFPLKHRKSVAAAMRVFMKRHQNIRLSGRLITLDGSDVFGVWRTV